jgi:phage tail protein X
MAAVIARQGETVDQIAARCYGGDTAMTLAILEANPGLAALGPILPHGTAVTLPERVAAPAAATINLWD